MKEVAARLGRDWRIYNLRWSVAFALLGLLLPIGWDGGKLDLAEVLLKKVVHVAFCTALGSFLGVLFTVMQNIANPRRYKALTWLLVFALTLTANTAYVAWRSGH